MCRLIKNLIEEIKPEEVVIEEVTFQANAATAKTLSRLQGAIMGICYMLDIPIFISFPSTWRKVLRFKQGGGVKREVLKSQAIELVKKEFNIDTDDDRADAICMGWAHCLDVLKCN